MTDSMIPNSFVPGTKAKASEVNENFIALANAITKNKDSAGNEFQNLNSTIADLSETINTQKADRSEIFSEFTVTDESTDLNDYLKKGTYIFSDTYIPVNAPKEAAGMLIIVGDNTSALNQTWICNGNETYTRTFQNEEWTAWKPLTGENSMANPGYIKFPGGLMLQWGYAHMADVTYPIAYSTYPAVVFMKHGYGASYTRSDTGFTEQRLTGFHMGTPGVISHLNYIAIGY